MEKIWKLLSNFEAIESGFWKEFASIKDSLDYIKDIVETQNDKIERIEKTLISLQGRRAAAGERDVLGPGRARRGSSRSATPATFSVGTIPPKMKLLQIARKSHFSEEEKSYLARKENFMKK